MIDSPQPSDRIVHDAPPSSPLSGRRVRRLLLAAVALVALLAVVPGGAAAQPSCGDVSYEQADDGAYLVETASQLQCIGSDEAGPGLDGYYRLTADIDLAEPATADPVSDWNGGDGFDPIGSESTPFTGTLDGNGHTISGLYAQRRTDDDIGLFGYVGESGWVVDLTLRDASIEADERVGVLAGASAGTTVDVAVHDSTVISASPTGGLIGGLQETGHVQGSTVSGSTVSGTTLTGGLVGAAWANTKITRSTVESSHVEALDETVGGFMGQGSSVTITESAVLDTSVGTEESFKNGGFIGRPSSADLRIARSYTENVSVVGSRHVGAFIGRNQNGVTMDSYVIDSDVTAGSQVGGFAGGNYQYGKTTRVYIANSDMVQTRPSGAPNYGFGSLTSTGGGVTDSYTSSGNTFVDDGEDVEITADIEEEGVTVLSPNQMQGDAAADNMAGFDFSSSCGVWTTASGEYPTLYWQENPDEDCDYDVAVDGAGSPPEPGEVRTRTTTASDPMTTTAETTTTTESSESPMTTEPSDTESPATTAADGPGFGVVVAAVALLAAGLLAIRRQD